MQHFEDIVREYGLGWNTREAFEKTKERDEIKNLWCKNNNIPLIRIPYTHFDDLCLNDLQINTSTYKI